MHVEGHRDTTGAAGCLDPGILDAYSAGRLSRAYRDLVAVHLDACPRCMAALLSRPDADPLVRSLRRAPDESDPAAPPDG